MLTIFQTQNEVPMTLKSFRKIYKLINRQCEGSSKNIGSVKFKYCRIRKKIDKSG